MIFQLPTGMHGLGVSARKWLKMFRGMLLVSPLEDSRSLVVKTMLSFNFNSHQPTDTERQGEFRTVQQGMTGPTW
jgi:hypothetical protein